MKRAWYLLPLYVIFTAATVAQPECFIDLSSAQVVDAVPTPHPATQPLSYLNAAPGSLVRVTVGFRFEPVGDVTRWYLLAVLLNIDHPYLDVVAPNPTDIVENVFWHPNVLDLGLRPQARAAASLQTAPIRANMLQPADAGSSEFSTSGATWVVLAPAGNTVTTPWYVGHVYVRVKENAPDNTHIPITLTRIADPERVLPNSLLATDGVQHYHLFGEHFAVEGATLRVQASRTQVVAQVTLEEFLGSAQGKQLEVQIRVPGTLDPVETHRVTLDEQSVFRITTALNGVYDFSVKGEHWLRRTLADVALNSTVHLNLSLQNGDVDGDNEVSLFDFGMLVAAFGSTAEDGPWNPSADLDGDEEVSLFDLGVLVRNFGLTGDE